MMAFVWAVWSRVGNPLDTGNEVDKNSGALHGVTTARRSVDGYRLAFLIHKWVGLAAALWLGVLGLTGFFLDHDSWRWQWQSKAPNWIVPQILMESSAKSVVRLLQIEPQNPDIQVSGGPRGLWFSRDGGRSWQPTAFDGASSLQTFAIEPDPSLGWARLWLATDDGVYVSQDRGATALRVTLPGQYVTSLTSGAKQGELIGVVDKAKMFRFDTDNPLQVTWINLQPPSSDSQPDHVNLQRYIFDLHFGHGLFGPQSSRLINDIGGGGLFILCLTGFLYWGLPKLWRYQAHRQNTTRTSPSTKKATILWLFRLHSVTIGIASVTMILYLSITGVFIGHNKELGTWMKSVSVSQDWLTPSFAISSWDGWIESVIAYPGQPDKLTIGNRVGLFTSNDTGNSWRRELDTNGNPITTATRLRRIGGDLLMPNGMSGPSVIRGDDMSNREVKPIDHSKHVNMSNMAGMFMPTDVTVIGDNYAWRSMDNILVTDSTGTEVDRRAFHQPLDKGVPWFTFFTRIHNGAIFWSEWRWVNDIFAIFAVFLMITGLIRWWRRKWA